MTGSIMMSGILFAILGLLIGSFLNATAMRWGSSQLGGNRSKCFSCGEKLKWKELIPVLSWAGQKGRCRQCECRINLRYPAVELVTSVSFILILLTSASPYEIALKVILISLLILLALIDLDQLILPHKLTIPFVAISFLNLFTDYFINEGLPSPEQLVAGPLLALFFWAIWAMTKGRGIGFADGTLALGIGWLLSPVAGISAVMYGFWIGAAVAVIMLIHQKIKDTHSSQNLSQYEPQKDVDKQLTLKSPIPFGPFLVLATILVWLEVIQPLQFLHALF